MVAEVLALARAARRAPLVAAALLAVGTQAAGAAPAPPRLALSAPHGVSLSLDTSSGSPQLAVSGLDLANAGGDLTLRATRTHGRVAIVQDVPGAAPHAVAQAHATRAVPYTLTEGLPGALSIQLSQHGRVVARAQASWCPKSGLEGVTTPPSCGDPLSRQVVWPLAHGQRDRFAAGARLARPLRDGSYRVVVRFDAAHRLRRAGGEIVWHGTANLSKSLSFPGGTQDPPKRQGTPPPSFQDQPADAANLAGLALPDLLPVAPERLAVIHDRHGDQLHFASAVADAGAPLVVDGHTGPTDPPGSMDASQVVAGPSGPVLHPAGHLVFDNDDGHDHWHFFALAHYRLTRAGSDASLRESTKVGFCFGDTDPFDMTVAGAPVAPIRLPLHVGSCEHGHPQATSVHMLLDAGWMDVYDQSVAGQAFDVTDLPNGHYAIVVQVNPRGILAETTTANDTVTRPFTLGGRRGARTVSVSPVDGVDTDAP